MEENVPSSINKEVLDIIFAFNQETVYERLLDTLITKLMNFTNSDAGTLYILEGNKLYFRIVKNKSLGISHTMDDVSSLPPIVLDDENITNASAYAAIRKETVIIENVYTDTRFNFTGPLRYDKMTGYRTQSMLVLPLVAHGKTEMQLLGVLQLINSQDKATGKVCAYQDADIAIVEAVSKIASNILSNFVFVQEIKQFDLLVHVTTQAIDERSSYNGSHTQNVSKKCRAFAEYLHKNFNPGDKYYFSETDINGITLAALLHDLGKIVTPLEIMDKADRFGAKISEIRYRFAIKGLQLEVAMFKGEMTKEDFDREKLSLEQALEFVEFINVANRITDEHLSTIKELSNMTYMLPDNTPTPLLDNYDIAAMSIRYGTLTPEEREIMQSHVEITSRLLDKIPFIHEYRKVPIWAANHHEFLDGSGYPNGLTADDLDVGSRMITILDIFDALIAEDRPYKAGVSIGRALIILNDMADEGKLDKELVVLFAQSKAWEHVDSY